MQIENIKPGEFFIDCSGRLCCCIKNNYEDDDLIGVPISDINTFSSCSFRYCGPEYVNSWELPFLIMVSKLAPKLGTISVENMEYLIELPLTEEYWTFYDKSIYNSWICNTEIYIEIVATMFRTDDENKNKYLDILFQYYDKLNLVYDFIEKSKIL